MITLYDFPLSGHAHTVRLMLGILGLDYESITVDLLGGEQRGADYRAINPFGQVPVLDDDGTIVPDSHAILVYLARKYGDGDWLPDDPVDLARVQHWLSVSAGEIYRGPNVCRLVKAFNFPLDYGPAADVARTLFSVMNAHLERQDWLALDRPTIADVACYSYTACAPEGGIDLGEYPAIQAWLGRVESLPGFVGMPKAA
ncbi:MAG: glutathione S-transferase [Alphaproteobacteria bacterium]|nr:glutathione S-transferase [Alphaproteobacteria bacterium]